MRKLFALILIALLLGVGVVAVIETDPGYLLVSYGNYTLESSLWVGLLLIAMLTLVLYVLLSLLRKLLGGQQSLAGWLEARRARTASRLTTRGLISFIEGDPARARQQLLRGARDNDTPLLNYLMAAQASSRLGETDKIQEYLGAAAGTDSGAALAVEITRAEIKLQSGEYGQALELLRGIRGGAARSSHVLGLLHKAYLGLGDWDSLAELLPDLKKHQVLSAQECNRLQHEVYTQLLVQSGKGGEQGAGPEQLRSYWKKLPANVRQDATMVRLYAGMLVEQGAHAAAEKVILRALKQHWDSSLVRMYGYVQGENLPRQLTQAESWLPAHPEDAQLLLCLGRLCARDKLWGKARDYFERSYRLERSSETCAELGRLLSGLGEPKVAAAYFREGLLMRESALPQLPMPEKTVPDSHRLAHS